MPASYNDHNIAPLSRPNAHGDKTYEDVWDNITQEELGYHKQKNLEISQNKDNIFT
jgi:hypothetical protein